MRNWETKIGEGKVKLDLLIDLMLGKRKEKLQKEKKNVFDGWPGEENGKLEIEIGKREEKVGHLTLTPNIIPGTYWLDVGKEGTPLPGII